MLVVTEVEFVLSTLILTWTPLVIP